MAIPKETQERQYQETHIHRSKNPTVHILKTAQKYYYNGHNGYIETFTYQEDKNRQRNTLVKTYGARYTKILLPESTTQTPDKQKEKQIHINDDLQHIRNSSMLFQQKSKRPKLDKWLTYLYTEQEIKAP